MLEDILNCWHPGKGVPLRTPFWHAFSKSIRIRYNPKYGEGIDIIKLLIANRPQFEFYEYTKVNTWPEFITTPESFTPELLEAVELSLRERVSIFWTTNKEKYLGKIVKAGDVFVDFLNSRPKPPAAMAFNFARTLKSLVPGIENVTEDRVRKYRFPATYDQPLQRPLNVNDLGDLAEPFTVRR